jgi:hypothetical protein
MRKTTYALFLASVLGACGSDDAAKADKPPAPAPAESGAGKGAAAKPAAQPGSMPAAKPPAAPDADQAAAGKPAADPVAAMDAAIATLMAKPEHGAEQVKVAHVLIAFQGAPRITGVTRSLAEAKTLAADVYERAVAGEDFAALMKQHSNDGGPGTYPMTKATRSGMVQGFGDVGWRLQVGEIGVAPHDDKKSPFGWHIIKRVE